MMVTSRQIKISFDKTTGRQRGWGFGAHAQVIGRVLIPFLREYIVPAANRVGADLFENTAPQVAEVVSG